MIPVAEEMNLRTTLDPAPSYAPTITTSTLGNGASLVARHSADAVSLNIVAACLQCRSSLNFPSFHHFRMYH